MVWGMMSFRGSSDLHIAPRGKTVTMDFYVEKLLKGKAALALKRRTEKGPPTKVKLLSDMSQAIFLAHITAKTQQARPFGGREHGQAPAQICHPSKTSGSILSTVHGKVDKKDPATSEAASSKTPFGLAQYLGRNVGQADVCDAGVHEGLCEEAW